jgi:hypothetical protein
MRACREAISDDEGLVRQWRVTRLTRLGIPGPLAEAEAGHAGWHQIARLARRGCPPVLAVRIVR